MERLSVSLDDKSVRLLGKYEGKYGVSKAEVIRKALATLDMVEENTKEVSLDTIKVYLDYLADREHLILDIEHWELIWEAMDGAPEEFWESVRESGRDHRVQYAHKGIEEVHDVLAYVEKTNWYDLKVDSSDSFTLVLASTKSSRFVKAFFEGFFEGHQRKVSVTNGGRKLRVLVK